MIEIALVNFRYIQSFFECTDALTSTVGTFSTSTVKTGIYNCAKVSYPFERLWFNICE